METIQPTTNGPHTRLELIQNRAIPSGQLKSNQLIIKPKQLTIQDIEKLQFGRVQDNNLCFGKKHKRFQTKDQSKDTPKTTYVKYPQLDLSNTYIASLSKARPKLAPFVFENKSLLKLANYLLRYRTGSLGTLYLYVDCIWHYTQRTGLSPRPINFRRQRRIRTAKTLQNPIPHQSLRRLHQRTTRQWTSTVKNIQLHQSHTSTYTE